MKKEVIAYVTGAINSYSKTIEVLKSDHMLNTVKSFEAVKDELTNILDYVEDIPEEETKDNVNADINDLAKVIGKDWGIIIRLGCNQEAYREKIRKLEAENSRLENTCKQLREENECLMHGSKGFKIS